MMANDGTTGGQPQHADPASVRSESRYVFADGSAVELLAHHVALSELWRASIYYLPKPPGSRGLVFRKVYPDEGQWYWVAWVGDRAEPVRNRRILDWLNALWRIVEAVYYGFEEILPFLRFRGDDREPRPVEMWEWGCIGLHQLWEAWSRTVGVIRAELKPAHFTFDGLDGASEPDLTEYELYYSRRHVMLLTDLLCRERAAKAKSQSRSRPGWHDTVITQVTAAGLGKVHKPKNVLEELVRRGLARRQGERVVVTATGGHEKEVSMRTFRHVARRALAADETPEK